MNLSSYLADAASRTSSLDSRSCAVVVVSSRYWRQPEALAMATDASEAVSYAADLSYPSCYYSLE